MKYRRSLTLAATLVFVALLGGCSSDNGPAGPDASLDTTPPPAPTAVSVDYDQPSGHYRLAWDASAAPDVTGYEVYLYSPDPSRDNAYIMIGSPSVEWCTLPDPESPDNWTLRVRAKDAAGNASPYTMVTGASVIPPSPTGLGGGGGTSGGGDGDRRHRLPE